MTSKLKKNIDKKPIQDLSALLDELDLTEISYQDGDFAVSVSRAVKNMSSKSSHSNSQASTVQESSDNDFSNDPRSIKSPMVGTVYLQSEPGANAFVKEGDQVKVGQTLLIIEAMKTMNPIESTLQGKIIKVLVQNEQAVEFGQPLMLIE